MPTLAPAVPVRPAPVAGWGASLRFLACLALATLAIRSAVVMPRSIPSASMMPALVPGDYVLVGKWPYGWSRFSLPWAPPGPHGRLFGRSPARGDVVVFRAPPDDRVDYVKRVIGLPGDTVAMRGGVPWLNGRPLGHVRLDATRWRETLPGGRSYDVLDMGPTVLDDTAPVTVPAGRYLMLGDNRDRSADSRVAPAAGGIGLVPAENIEGRALFIPFSTAGFGRIGRIG